MTTYVAVLRRGRGKRRILWIPDIDLQLAVSDDRERTRMVARELLHFEMCSRSRSGEPLPEPTPLGRLLDDPDIDREDTFLLDTDDICVTAH